MLWKNQHPFFWQMRWLFQIMNYSFFVYFPLSISSTQVDFCLISPPDFANSFLPAFESCGESSEVMVMKAFSWSLTRKHVCLHPEELSGPAVQSLRAKWLSSDMQDLDSLVNHVCRFLVSTVCIWTSAGEGPLTEGNGGLPSSIFHKLLHTVNVLNLCSYC